MGAASFVAGDWGTSHLRLFLCDAQEAVLDSSLGPGAAEVGGRFSEVFASLTARWEQPHGTLPAVLCEMGVSVLGWFQARYAACPPVPESNARALVNVHSEHE